MEGQEELSQYAERIDHYFVANEVDGAEKKKAVFLSIIGPQYYKLLASLVTPAKPGEKTYTEMVAALTKHYDPQPSEILQRFCFHTRFRKYEETVATYVSALRSLAQKCNFKAGTMDEMLRDRLVCAINEDTIQRRMLSEVKLTYDNALELAHTWEAAMKNVIEMQSASTNLKEECTAPTAPAKQVHLVPSEGYCRGRKPCYQCGGTNFVPSQCRFIGKHCFNCGKLRHTARACRNKKQSSTYQPGARNPVRVVQVDSTEPKIPSIF